MALIEVEDGLRVRFPGRDPAFLEGVEIGLLLSDLAAGVPVIERRMRTASLPQARELAEAFGYRLAAAPDNGGWTEIHCGDGRARPRLTLVR
jgi:hypothetical protein